MAAGSDLQESIEGSEDKGAENPADLSTKFLSAADTELQCARMNVELVKEVVTD